MTKKLLAHFCQQRFHTEYIHLLNIKVQLQEFSWTGRIPRGIGKV